MAGPNYIQTYQDNLSLQITDSYFAIDYIDSGTLYWAFERFSAGAQFISGESSKIELFYDADGTAKNLVLIDAIYTIGETYQHDFDTSVTYPYNISISRVLIRRTAWGISTSDLSPTPREIYGQWQGMVV
jgi:hypothetical protein